MWQLKSMNQTKTDNIQQERIYDGMRINAPKEHFKEAKIVTVPARAVTDGCFKVDFGGKWFEGTCPPNVSAQDQISPSFP